MLIRNTALILNKPARENKSDPVSSSRYLAGVVKKMMIIVSDANNNDDRNKDEKKLA